MEQNGSTPENSEKALTSIRPAYTLATTNEVDEMIIRQFLNTLAEVALAVAARKIGKEVTR